MKYAARITIMALFGSLSMICSASEWKRGFDGAAGAASLGSFYYWANACGNAEHMNRKIAFRLAVDALGVATSWRGGKDLGVQGKVINLVSCVGSLASLVWWLPVILKNLHNPLYVWRGVTDIAQMVSSAIRIKDNIKI